MIERYLHNSLHLVQWVREMFLGRCISSLSLWLAVSLLYICGQPCCGGVPMIPQNGASLPADVNDYTIEDVGRDEGVLARKIGNNYGVNLIKKDVLNELKPESFSKECFSEINPSSVDALSKDVLFGNYPINRDGTEKKMGINLLQKEKLLRLNVGQLQGCNVDDIKGINEENISYLPKDIVTRHFGEFSENQLKKLTYNQLIGVAEEKIESNIEHLSDDVKLDFLRKNDRGKIVDKIKNGDIDRLQKQLDEEKGVDNVIKDTGFGKKYADFEIRSNITYAEPLLANDTAAFDTFLEKINVEEFGDDARSVFDQVSPYAIMQNINRLSNKAKQIIDNKFDNNFISKRDYVDGGNDYKYVDGIHDDITFIGGYDDACFSEYLHAWRHIFRNNKLRDGDLKLLSRECVKCLIDEGIFDDDFLRELTPKQVSSIFCSPELVRVLGNKLRVISRPALKSIIHNVPSEYIPLLGEKCFEYKDDENDNVSAGLLKPKQIKHLTSTQIVNAVTDDKKHNLSGPKGEGYVVKYLDCDQLNGIKTCCIGCDCCELRHVHTGDRVLDAIKRAKLFKHIAEREGALKDKYCRKIINGIDGQYVFDYFNDFNGEQLFQITVDKMRTLKPIEFGVSLESLDRKIEHLSKEQIEGLFNGYDDSTSGKYDGSKKVALYGGNLGGWVGVKVKGKNGSKSSITRILFENNQIPLGDIVNLSSNEFNILVRELCDGKSGNNLKKHYRDVFNQDKCRPYLEKLTLGQLRGIKCQEFVDAIFDNHLNQELKYVDPIDKKEKSYILESDYEKVRLAGIKENGGLLPGNTIYRYGFIRSWVEDLPIKVLVKCIGSLDFDAYRNKENNELDPRLRSILGFIGGNRRLLAIKDEYNRWDDRTKECCKKICYELMSNGAFFPELEHIHHDIIDSFVQCPQYGIVRFSKSLKEQVFSEEQLRELQERQYVDDYISTGRDPTVFKVLKYLKDHEVDEVSNGQRTGKKVAVEKIDNYPVRISLIDNGTIGHITYKTLDWFIKQNNYGASNFPDSCVKGLTDEQINCLICMNYDSFNYENGLRLEHYGLGGNTLDFADNHILFPHGGLEIFEPDPLDFYLKSVDINNDKINPNAVRFFNANKIPGEYFANNTNGGQLEINNANIRYHNGSVLTRLIHRICLEYNSLPQEQKDRYNWPANFRERIRNSGSILCKRMAESDHGTCCLYPLLLSNLVDLEDCIEYLTADQLRDWILNRLKQQKYSKYKLSKTNKINGALVKCIYHRINENVVNQFVNNKEYNGVLYELIKNECLKYEHAELLTADHLLDYICTKKNEYGIKNFADEYVENLDIDVMHRILNYEFEDCCDDCRRINKKNMFSKNNKCLYCCNKPECRKYRPAAWEILKNKPFDCLGLVSQECDLDFFIYLGHDKTDRDVVATISTSDETRSWSKYIVTKLSANTIKLHSNITKACGITQLKCLKILQMLTTDLYYTYCNDPTMACDCFIKLIDPDVLFLMKNYFAVQSLTDGNGHRERDINDVCIATNKIDYTLVASKSQVNRMLQLEDLLFGDMRLAKGNEIRAQSKRKNSKLDKPGYDFYHKVYNEWIRRPGDGYKHEACYKLAHNGADDFNKQKNCRECQLVKGVFCGRCGVCKDCCEKNNARCVRCGLNLNSQEQCFDYDCFLFPVMSKQNFDRSKVKFYGDGYDDSESFQLLLPKDKKETYLFGILGGGDGDNRRILTDHFMYPPLNGVRVHGNDLTSDFYHACKKLRFASDKNKINPGRYWKAFKENYKKKPAELYPILDGTRSNRPDESYDAIIRGGYSVLCKHMLPPRDGLGFIKRKLSDCYRQIENPNASFADKQRARKNIKEFSKAFDERCRLDIFSHQCKNLAFSGRNVYDILNSNDDYLRRGFLSAFGNGGFDETFDNVRYESVKGAFRLSKILSIKFRRRESSNLFKKERLSAGVDLARGAEKDCFRAFEQIFKIANRYITRVAKVFDSLRMYFYEEYHKSGVSDKGTVCDNFKRIYSCLINRDLLCGEFVEKVPMEILCLLLSDEKNMALNGGEEEYKISQKYLTFDFLRYLSSGQLEALNKITSEHHNDGERRNSKKLKRYSYVGSLNGINKGHVIKNLRDALKEAIFVSELKPDVNAPDFIGKFDVSLVNRLYSDQAKNADDTNRDEFSESQLRYLNHVLRAYNNKKSNEKSNKTLPNIDDSPQKEDPKKSIKESSLAVLKAKGVVDNAKAVKLNEYTDKTILKVQGVIGNDNKLHKELQDGKIRTFGEKKNRVDTEIGNLNNNISHFNRLESTVVGKMRRKTSELPGSDVYNSIKTKISPNTYKTKEANKDRALQLISELEVHKSQDGILPGEFVGEFVKVLGNINDCDKHNEDEVKVIGRFGAFFRNLDDNTRNKIIDNVKDKNSLFFMLNNRFYLKEDDFRSILEKCLGDGHKEGFFDLILSGRIDASIIGEFSRLGGDDYEGKVGELCDYIIQYEEWAYRNNFYYKNVPDDANEKEKKYPKCSKMREVLRAIQDSYPSIFQQNFIEFYSDDVILWMISMNVFNSDSYKLLSETCGEVFNELLVKIVSDKCIVRLHNIEAKASVDYFYANSGFINILSDDQRRIVINKISELEYNAFGGGYLGDDISYIADLTKPGLTTKHSKKETLYAIVKAALETSPLYVRVCEFIECDFNKRVRNEKFIKRFCDEGCITNYADLDNVFLWQLHNHGGIYSCRYVVDDGGHNYVKVYLDSVVSGLKDGTKKYENVFSRKLGGGANSPYAYSHFQKQYFIYCTIRDYDVPTYGALINGDNVVIRLFESLNKDIQFFGIQDPNNFWDFLKFFSNNDLIDDDGQKYWGNIIDLILDPLSLDHIIGDILVRPITFGQYRLPKHYTDLAGFAFKRGHGGNLMNGDIRRYKGLFVSLNKKGRLKKHINGFFGIEMIMLLCEFDHKTLYEMINCPYNCDDDNYANDYHFSKWNLLPDHIKMLYMFNLSHKKCGVRFKTLDGSECNCKASFDFFVSKFKKGDCVSGLYNFIRYVLDDNDWLVSCCKRLGVEGYESQVKDIVRKDVLSNLNKKFVLDHTNDAASELFREILEILKQVDLCNVSKISPDSGDILILSVKNDLQLVNQFLCEIPLDDFLSVCDGARHTDARLYYIYNFVLNADLTVDLYKNGRDIKNKVNKALCGDDNSPNLVWAPYFAPNDSDFQKNIYMLLTGAGRHFYETRRIICRYFDDSVLKLLDEGTFKVVYGPQIADKFDFENTIFYPGNFSGCGGLLECPKFVSMLKSLAEGFALMYFQKPVDMFGGNWFKMVDYRLGYNRDEEGSNVLLTPLFEKCPHAVYEYILRYVLESRDDDNWRIIEDCRNDVSLNNNILKQERFKAFLNYVGYDETAGMRVLVTDGLGILRYSLGSPSVDILHKFGYERANLDNFFNFDVSDDEFDIVVRQMLGDTSCMMVIQNMMIK